MTDLSGWSALFGAKKTSELLAEDLYGLAGRSADSAGFEGTNVGMSDNLGDMVENLFVSEPTAFEDGVKDGVPRLNFFLKLVSSGVAGTVEDDGLGEVAIARGLEELGATGCWNPHPFFSYLQNP